MLFDTPELDRLIHRYLDAIKIGLVDFFVRSQRRLADRIAIFFPDQIEISICQKIINHQDTVAAYVGYILCVLSSLAPCTRFSMECSC